jgi:hypothetical protein
MTKSPEAITAITAGILVAGALLAWEFLPVQVGVSSGSYDLAVRIECSSGKPKSVACSPFFSRESAEGVVAYEDPESPEWHSVAAPFMGGVMTVSIPNGSRHSPMGRLVSYSQARYLGVVASLEDGRKVGCVVEIPNRGASNEIVVKLSQEPRHAEPGVGADSR